jgi:ribosomal protein S18 acetylase RimI-like enzyme
MEPHEADPVAHLFEDVLSTLPYYNELAKATELSKYSAAALQKAIQEDPDSILVAIVKGEIVGFCFSRMDDTLVWLSWFGVRRDMRQRRIGSLLLEALEETLRRGRSHKMWCDCRTENAASAVALMKHGFVRLCTVRNHWYGQDFYLWEKPVG